MQIGLKRCKHLWKIAKGANRMFSTRIACSVRESHVQCTL